MFMRLTFATIGTAAALGLGVGAIAQSLDATKMTQPTDMTYPNADDTEMVARGQELFENPEIGESGLACTSCHAEFGQYKETFKEPYPHFVQMAQDRAGMDEVTAAEMVQLCMVVPMQSEPLPWDSDELKALVAYVKDEQQRFSAQ